MQALLQKQKEGNRLQGILGNSDLSVEERVEKVRNLQFVDHQPIFSVNYTTIHKAAKDGDVPGLKYFLEIKSRQKRRINSDDPDNHGWCPFHYSCQNGHIPALEYLLSKGSDVDVKTSEGVSGLMIACMEGQVEVIRFLIFNGASVICSDRSGQTPAHFAASYNKDKAIVKLVQYYKLFQDMIINFHKQSTKEDPRGNVQIRRENSKKSSKKGSSNVQNDEMIEKKDENIMKEVQLAPSNDIETKEEVEVTENVKEFLRKKRLIPSEILETTVLQLIDSASNNGYRPLHLAAETNSFEALRTLVELGANINSKDNTSAADTPLHKAARLQFRHIYKYLVDHGADEYALNKLRESSIRMIKDDRYF